ncbi:MAG: CAAX prenyl protease-related protein [Verrucomicrobiota bacterium]|nr:CAAX prenyl protease-related protein [Verrucomicrobiota bacterium]
MNSVSNRPAASKLVAYTAPMVVFIATLSLVGPLKKIGGSAWMQAPEYWLYPLQTLICGALLVWFWRRYEWRAPAGLPYALLVAVVVWVIWISPQAFLGFAPRTSGFNPDTFATQPVAYWFTVMMRFLRLVIVVPLVEEIAWRGFLLRYLIHEKFDEVPIGAFSWFSFAAVTLAFTLVHSPADWAAAAITGALYNTVAYRTKSLSACVVTHAVTNLLLGLWIMHTKQWGFW